MGAIVSGWDDAGYARDQAEDEGFLIADRHRISAISMR